MRRLAQLLGASCVAAALPAWSYVLAQAEKAAAPAPGGTTTETTTVEKTVEKGEAKPVFAPKKEVAKQAAAPIPGGTTTETTTVEKTFRKAEAKPVIAPKMEMTKQADVKVQFRAMPARVAENNLEPMIRQFLPQIRPIMRAEVHLIRTVCAPTKEQRAVIAREGERLLKEAAKQYAEFQQPVMRGRPNSSKPQPDLRKLIADGLVAVVKANFTPEQAARYVAEAEKRDAETKRIAVTNLVASMDDDLILTAAQRAKLVETLTLYWDNTWADMIEIMVSNPQFFPNIHDQLVMPVLTEPQKKVWSQKVKQQGNFFGVNVRNMGQIVLEEPDEVEDTKADGAEERKP